MVAMVAKHNWAYRFVVSWFILLQGLDAIVKKAGKLTNDKAPFARLAGGWQVLVQGQGFFQLYRLQPEWKSLLKMFLVIKGKIL